MAAMAAPVAAALAVPVAVVTTVVTVPVPVPVAAVVVVAPIASAPACGRVGITALVAVAAPAIDRPRAQPAADPCAERLGFSRARHRLFSLQSLLGILPSTQRVLIHA